jgi:opacity protein-like surface antigen
MKKVLSGLMLLSLFVGSQAFAEQTTYGLIGVGSVTMDNAGLLPNPNAVRVAYGTKSETGASFLSTEIEALIFSDSVYSIGSSKVTLSQYAIRANGIMGFKLNNDFALTGKLGVTMNNAKLAGTGIYAGTNSSASTFDITYGVGAEYYVSKKVTLSANWESLGKFKADSAATGSSATQIAVGVAYNF